MTYEQLMKHYWGVIVPMAEKHGIEPWLCVRRSGGKGGYAGLADHPLFEEGMRYEFALAALGDKPVFIGSRLYSKDDPRGPRGPWTVEGMFSSGSMSLNNGPQTMALCTTILEEHLTWAPPEFRKTRVIAINGKEFDAPVKLSDRGQATLTVALNNVEQQFRFKEYANAVGVFYEITRTLSTEH